MIILSGRPFRKEHQEKLSVLSKTIRPRFLFVNPQKDEDALAYVRQIQKILLSLGLDFEEEEVKPGEEEKSLARLREMARTHQVVLARPLGKREKEFLSLLDPMHDPDMMTTTNIGHLFQGELHFLPATCKSVEEILRKYNLPVLGKKVLIVGRSLTIGLPLLELFQRLDAMPTLVHSKIDPERIAKECSSSDIVCLCSGVEGLIPRPSFRPCQVVLDCGFHAQGGDLGFLPEEDELFAYTPVPGGIGSLTPYFVVENGFFHECRLLKSK